MPGVFTLMQYHQFFCPTFNGCQRTVSCQSIQQYLHHRFAAGDLEHLPAPLGAIRQRKVDDLCVPRELWERSSDTSFHSGGNVVAKRRRVCLPAHKCPVRAFSHRKKETRGNLITVSVSGFCSSKCTLTSSQSQTHQEPQSAVHMPQHVTF